MPAKNKRYFMEKLVRKKPSRGVYLLPNMLTTVSMFLGFLAIVWAGNGKFEGACLAILVSALMDSLDGKVARLTNTASEFGVQYDSLADLIAFGLAPAFLLWHWQLHNIGRAGLAAAFIYTACGAMRLARFNVSTATIGKRFFVGLPIPAAGCTVLTFVFFSKIIPDSLNDILPYASLILAICCGLLMISRIRYFSFKEYDFLRDHPVRSMVSFLFLLGFLISVPRLFSFLYCIIYICSGVLYSYYLLPKYNRSILRNL